MTGKFVVVAVSFAILAYCADSRGSASAVGDGNLGLSTDSVGEAQLDVASQCNAIFDTRKDEIKADLIRLRQQRADLQTVVDENTKMLKQKEEELDRREVALKKMRDDIEAERLKSEAESKQRLDSAKRILAQNEDVLKQIRNEKNSKLSQGYSKMKDSKAAPILSSMPESEAVKILLSLSPADMGKILSKMDPLVAARLTGRINLFLDSHSSGSPTLGAEKAGSDSSADKKGETGLTEPESSGPSMTTY